MNILIISHGVPSQADTQWGCFELDQARALSSLGHKVTVAAIDGRFRESGQKRGITVTSFNSIKAYLLRYFPLRLLLIPFLIIMVRNLMMKHLFVKVCSKEGIPDAIYAHYLFNMDSLSLVHKRNPQIPIIGIEHWSHLSRTKLSSLDRARGNIGYNLVDRLLSVSPHLQEQIQKHFGKQSEIVYDMVDRAFLQVPIQKNKPVNPFRFISVGSLNKVKGFEVLLKAFANCSDYNSELVIIGDGPLKDALVNLSKELSISERVFFKGRLAREDIVTYLSSGNAYVLASKSETFGVSYVEAMAMGLPVIATRCGGPESFMNDACGLMVDVDDIDGLTAAMDRLIEHIGDYDPIAIREYVRSRFSGEEIAKQLEAIFLEEIKKKQQ